MNLLESKPYKVLYDVVRKNKTLNYLAHKVMQSETIRKFPPYMAIYNKIIQTKTQKYLKVPDILEFEVSNKCNARCIMCPPELHLGEDFIPHDLFIKIAKEGYELGIRKMIITGGEPLLDKQIYEKISYAKKLGYTYVHMFTNGSPLTEKNQEKLLATGLDSLTISFDSPIKEEYEKIRINLKFEQVVKNIKDFYILKRNKKLSKPLIRLNLTTLPENKQGRKEFVRIFKNYADICEIMDAHNWAESKEIKVAAEELFKSREYTQLSRDPCHMLFIKACVTPEGYLRKCSIDFADHAFIDDLNKISLKEALFNKKLLDIKENHLSRNFCEPGCINCVHRESWWVDLMG